MGNKHDKKIAKVKLDPVMENNLRAMFFKFDTSGNGSLTKEEIMAKFASKPEEGESLVKQLFAMDKDKNGEIDLDEFMFFWKAVKF